MKRLVLIFSLIFFTVGVDQVTKVLARDYLRGQMGYSYFGGLFRLEYAENTGAFLSLGAQLPESLRLAIFVVIVAVFLVGAGIYLVRQKIDMLSTVGLSFLVGGGLGNLIDRAFYGAVTDFLFMGWGPIRTGVFNVADMAIVLGVGLVLIQSWKPKKT